MWSYKINGGNGEVGRFFPDDKTKIRSCRGLSFSAGFKMVVDLCLAPVSCCLTFHLHLASNPYTCLAISPAGNATPITLYSVELNDVIVLSDYNH